LLEEFVDKYELLPAFIDPTNPLEKHFKPFLLSANPRRFSSTPAIPYKSPRLARGGGISMSISTHDNPNSHADTQHLPTVANPALSISHPGALSTVSDGDYSDSDHSSTGSSENLFFSGVKKMNNPNPTSHSISTPHHVHITPPSPTLEWTMAKTSKKGSSNPLTTSNKSKPKFVFEPCENPRF